MENKKETTFSLEELAEVLEFVTFQTINGKISIEEAGKHALGIFEMLEGKK